MDGIRFIDNHQFGRNLLIILILFGESGLKRQEAKKKETGKETSGIDLQIHLLKTDSNKKD